MLERQKEKKGVLARSIEAKNISPFFKKEGKRFNIA